MNRCKEIASRLEEDVRSVQGRRVDRKLNRALVHFQTKKLCNQLNYNEAAVVAQLRTLKACLKEPLYKIKRAEAPSCGYGAEKETVRHFLLECPR